jgi:hypothetical protein
MNLASKGKRFGHSALGARDPTKSSTFLPVSLMPSAEALFGYLLNLRARRSSDQSSPPAAPE